jgi:hypothetical protein
MWFVRPQLFFHCTLRLIGTAAGCYNRSDEDVPLDLIFFSPFEELRLPVRTAGIMKSKDVHRVYEPHLFPLSTLEGLRTSLAEFHSFHVFWTEIQPQLFHISTEGRFECGCADGAGHTSRRGSHVYEINTWLWDFGRPQPRVRGLSVAKTDKLRRKSRSEASKR